MRAVALLLALLVGAQCAAGQYQGFIRTSNLKFVDDNCKEFVPLGMNTYDTSPARRFSVALFSAVCFAALEQDVPLHSYLAHCIWVIE